MHKLWWSVVIRSQNDLFLGQVLWLHPVFGKCFTSIPVFLVVLSGCVVFLFLCLNLLGGGVFYCILSSIRETAHLKWWGESFEKGQILDTSHWNPFVGKAPSSFESNSFIGVLPTLKYSFFLVETESHLQGKNHCVLSSTNSIACMWC